MKRKRVVIGICGRARSGKDTVADELKRWGFQKIAFADKLKSICKDLFDLSGSQLYSNSKEIMDNRWEKSPRMIFQEVGDIMRDVHGAVWISQVVKKVKKEKGDFAVTDIRYYNELKAVRDLAGPECLVRIWNIQRPNAPEVHGSNSHISETEMLTIPIGEFDEVIKNDNLFDTKIKIEKLMSKIGEEMKLCEE